MKRQVWIISEGSPGHVSQCEGFVAALARRMDIGLTRVETRPRLNGFLRKLVRLWMGAAGRALPDRMLRGVLGCVPPENPRPDLIVSSGGKAVFAARSIAVRTGVPLVFIGERKPYPSGWFHTVLTPSPSERGVNDVPLERIPTKITVADVENAAVSWADKPEGRIWAMIVGGGSASHFYQESDWQALAEGMNAIAAREGICWLVSTSRRSGAEAERILRGALDARHVAYGIWWSEKPERLMLAMLGAAEAVFVTQDSVTMVTEALASGKPVVVLAPTDVRFPAGSFLPDYFGRLVAQQAITRCPIRSLADWDSNTLPVATSDDGADAAVDVVLARLGGCFSANVR